MSCPVYPPAGFIAWPLEPMSLVLFSGWYYRVVLLLSGDGARSPGYCVANDLGMVDESILEMHRLTGRFSA